MIAGLKTTGTHDPVGDVLMADANIRGRQKIRQGPRNVAWCFGTYENLSH